ncbi:MAG: ribose 5-phosphate isomerase B [Clostridia bacterium]|nr:ribose 5-phosphate isomerase B [Clostridia bacterium]
MIAIASDHAGFALKEKIKKHLEELKFVVCDFGTENEESCDYPVFAKKACEAVVSGKCDRAILVCGTGIGMSMAANKVRGIRAAVCTETFAAKYTRLHNDANVLCMGARVIGEGVAIEITDTFITTEFEGGKHKRRIDMFE